MILKASQRANANQLAGHLLNTQDNEHVELHELRGFLSEDLYSALNETEAIAKGTRCQQFLFSLSLSPPETENVPVETFETAIEMIEQKLGLDDHPRVIVFHEKEGRRHAHAVWSRIDAQTMTAKQLPFFKNRLMEVSKELYLEHGWELPKGFIDRELRNPLNFSLKEWQQAKRTQQDPRMVKAMFQESWQRSDNAKALKEALQEKGYFIARGDRRTVVAVDIRGEVYSLARWSGVKAKDVRDRFGQSTQLPSVEEVKMMVSERMDEKLKSLIHDVGLNYRRLRPAIEYQRTQMVERQKKERTLLSEKLDKRQRHEAQQRAARLPRGLGGLWSHLTGKTRRIKQQNEYEAWQAYRRDAAEKEKLIVQHLEERQRLQQKIKILRQQRSQEIADLQREMTNYLKASEKDTRNHEISKEPKPRAHPRQESTHEPKYHSGPTLEMD
ncbi:relaxase/mobilization nuclease domain-containing protein [Labrenzia sp. 5N]|uniref:relaxase/mobilization nuclease domain-containing protein n=1 Tax=Labrenzia sp. 5N TaxID=2723402 RepID=UPI0014464246|nr:relaxase/mobilization nuclease domain-containing protein [Labrenzia sp. 5N]NKX63273.1 relaxase/mobilization nuclease domain-containing protein [Labrenzia sp. 5N]